MIQRICIDIIFRLLSKVFSLTRFLLILYVLFNSYLKLENSLEESLSLIFAPNWASNSTPNFEEINYLFLCKIFSFRPSNILINLFIDQIMVIGLEILIQFSLILVKVSLIVLRLELFEIVSCFFFFFNSHIELFGLLDTLSTILRHVKFLDSVSDR